jgi:replicative DNA helicase
MYAERLPPHDIEAEEAVIGSLLIDGDSIVRVAPLLRPGDFYRERNRWSFQACHDLFERGVAVDQISVADELGRQDLLEQVGGMAYLSHLVTTVPTSVNVEDYARIVNRTSTMRQIIDAAREIAAIGYEDGPDEQASLSKAEEALFRIRSRRSVRDFVHIREVLDRYLEDTAAAAAGPSSRGTGPIPTGFADLDQLLGSLQRSDLVILAARPSLGKTALALNIARNATEIGASCAIFSLEMSAEQLALRLLASEARVDGHRLRLGLYTQDEGDRLIESIGVLSDLPLYLDDTPMQRMVEIRSKARRLHLEQGLDFIILDYLQLLHSGEGRQENRVQEVSEISRSLKGLARDLNVPVLACSQLSRQVEQRPSHRPQLSDLRESGSIEQDADVVAFIHREDLYTSEDEWGRRFPDRPYPKNIADIIVAKHRHGPVGSVQLYFNHRLARFQDASTTGRSS